MENDLENNHECAAVTRLEVEIFTFERAKFYQSWPLVENM